MTMAICCVRRWPGPSGVPACLRNAARAARRALLAVGAALLMPAWASPAPPDLLEEVAVFIDAGGTATIDDVATRPFRPARTQVFFGNQPHPVWLRVRLRSAPAGSAWELSLWPPFIHAATLYQRAAEGPWQATTIGARFAHADRPVAALGLTFPLQLTPGEPSTVYVLLRTPTPLAMVDVQPPAQRVEQEQAVLAVFAAFMGAIPLLLVISVVAWWITGVRIWLVFAGFEFVTGLSVAVQSGLGARFLLPHASDLFNHLHPIGVFGQLFFSAAVFAQFCHFVGAPRWLGRGFRAALAVMPVNLALQAAGQLPLALHLNNLAAVYLVVLTLPLVVVPYRGDRIVGLAVRISAAYSAVFHGLFFLPWLPFVEREHDYLFMRFSTMPTLFVTACITLTVAFRQTQLALRERQQLHELAREAERQLAAAQEASEAKSAFLAYMSHEIRNPLNAVTGLADLAREANLPAPTRNAYLQMLSDSANALSHTISEVLDISKIEAGKMQPEVVPFDLDALLNSLHAVYLPLARQKGLALQLTPAQPGFGWVRGDPGRLRQVLGNFLSNALKFTDQGRIELAVSAQEGQGWRFEVRDSGPGMTPQQQARLFSPYVQVGGQAERLAGTGLGLAICRELARLMGGDVGVNSEPGQGSRFWLELALPPASAPPAPAERPEAPGFGGELAGKRLLVADDVQSNHTVMEALLRREGALPLLVADGAEAVAAVRRAFDQGLPFDLVLMDVHMHGVDGLEATRQIRRLGEAGRLPIVALSGGVSTQERQQALDAGMDDFLAKPLSLPRLRDCVRCLTSASV